MIHPMTFHPEVHFRDPHNPNNWVPCCDTHHWASAIFRSTDVATASRVLFWMYVFFDHFKNFRIWNHPSCGWTIVIHGHVLSFWHHLCTFGWANTIQPIQPSGAVVHIQHEDSLVGICNSEKWISIWHALNHGLKRYRRCINGFNVKTNCRYLRRPNLYMFNQLSEESGKHFFRRYGRLQPKRRQHPSCWWFLSCLVALRWSS